MAGISVNLAPIFNGWQGFTPGGLPLNGGLIYTYLAGTTTPEATYTAPATGTQSQNANPIVLNTDGRPPSEIWLIAGQAYKFVLNDAQNNLIATYDNLIGINDIIIPSASEWTLTNLTPTFVSTTSFTLPGDQTGIFHAKRRVRLQETAGTVYGVVTSSSVISSVTTVNVTIDSGGTVDNGLSAVSYGILDSINPSIPQIITAGSGVTVTYAAGIPTISAGNDVCDFRLTLTSGTPVTTGNVTGATTIYCTPYKGNYISLYDGSANWNLISSAEFSVALGTLTSGLPYDVFCFNNAGTATLEILAWTNGTTRATALTTQNGILVKNGATTRRYMGTFVTTSTTQTEDSASNRYLWNYYNRVRRPMQAIDATATWAYSTATWRQANANTANQLNFVIGVSEDEIIAGVHSNASSTVVGQMSVGIGVDSTTANSATVWGGVGSGQSSIYYPQDCTYRGFPGVGKHFLAWLEISNVGSGTQTWGGTQTTGISGINGDIPA